MHVDWKDVPHSLQNPDASLLSTAEVHEADPEHIRNLPGNAVKQERGINNERIAMHTGDFYHHMEVRIVKGGNKGNLGMVRGSHFSQEGRMFVEVLTTTMANNTFSSYPIQNLRERLYV